jgi:Family of unknown function (DUF5923)
MSCCGFGRKSKGADTEPLLPRYEDETARQRRLHQKLHTYQMIRALSKGYMPSTEQTIINLRTLLASDVLNPNNKDLSQSGRRLVRNCRELLKQFIELLLHKNRNDQIQDFIWYLTKSRVSLDLDDVSRQASKAKAKADVSASEMISFPGNDLFADTDVAYESLRTVGSLLLTNTDFRIFVDDLGTIGRQILSDTAFSLSTAAEETGKKLEPSDEQKKAITGPDADQGSPSTKDDLTHEAEQVSKALVNGVGHVGKDAITSAKERVSGQQKDTLIHRLKKTVMGLRTRTDYSDSVSTISKLIQQYAVVYSRAADATIATAQDDVHTNPALDRAVRNFWDLLSSFGNRDEWRKLEEDFKKVMAHAQKDPQFEHFMQDVGNSVQKMLTDPDFFDQAEEKIGELREKSSHLGNDSDVKADLDTFFRQLKTTVRAVLEDEDVSKMIVTSRKIFEILSPLNSATNPDLITDSLNIFLPLLIRSIQNVPIPRVEVSVPEMDLLIENLIIEPGRTVNATSFLPYWILVTTRNDLEIRKAHSKRTISSITSLITVSINGLSVSAQDLGFWLRAHSGPFRFSDEGIASFALDERGIDVTLDLEVGRERLEEILTLRGVKVHIHKLDYTLRKSKLSWVGWLFKPFLKHLVRRALEKTMAESIAEFLHAANRELLFARERLRATRIADPQDIATFIKAVITRLTPTEDPDVYTRIGVDAPDKGVFKNVYTPGSIVKLWHEEAMRAEDAVEDAGEQTGGWRNEIFDVAV